MADITNVAKTAPKRILTPAQKRKRAMRAKACLRTAIRLFFFLAMPGAFVAGFSGVKYLFRWMGEGVPLEINSFIKVLIGLGLFTILFGRFFCGYICAFGSVGDAVYWISGLVQKKVLHRKKQYNLPPKARRIGQKLKYLNLIFIVAGCTLGFYENLVKTSPWDVFSQLLALRLPTGYVVGIAFCIVIVIGMAVGERFFCQFLCPMGAVFALLPILPFGMPRRNADQCIKGCQACRSQCPVDIRLEPDSIRGGECIACGKCMQVCPKGNIQYREQAIWKYDWISVMAKAFMFFVMGAYLGLCRFF